MFSHWAICLCGKRRIRESVDIVYESDLHEMSREQLLSTLSSVQRTWERRRWRVEEAELVAEIRQELALRGVMEPSLDDVFADLARLRSGEGNGSTKRAR